MSAQAKDMPDALIILRHAERFLPVHFPEVNKTPTNRNIFEGDEFRHEANFALVFPAGKFIVGLRHEELQDQYCRLLLHGPAVRR